MWDAGGVAKLTCLYSTYCNKRTAPLYELSFCTNFVFVEMRNKQHKASKLVFAITITKINLPLAYVTLLLGVGAANLEQTLLSKVLQAFISLKNMMTETTSYV